MLIIAGAVPIKDLQLTTSFCSFEDGKLKAGEVELPLINGTSVMIAAAATACKTLQIEMPYAILAGDIGTGEGSNQIYRYLKDKLNPNAKDGAVMAMHYIKPNILYAKDAIKNVKKRFNPKLIADAGSMYVAKAAGISKDFTLFTPDPGEMAFLADPEAMHPAYVRNYIFDAINDTPKLIKQACENGNVPEVMLVKGKVDYVVTQGKTVAQVTEPCIPVLEAIGGTGDTLAGMVSALIASGTDTVTAATQAAKANRIMGELAKPTPATKIWEMVPQIPQALKTAKQP
ncbi:MAG: sugar kinase [Candidatus Bathyarchaeota archaeon]|nr:sugar kinase [Candidatus Bathyarchaeota archaeon]